MGTLSLRKNIWPLILLCLVCLFILAACVDTDDVSEHAAAPTVAPQPTQKLGTCKDVITAQRLTPAHTRLYFNDCSLHHLNELAGNVNAGANIASLLATSCPDCEAEAFIGTAGLQVLVSFIQAKITEMLDESHICGDRGVYLNLGITNFWTTEKAC